MTAYRRTRLSDAERDERRNADRERVKEAAGELLSSEGWGRWVRTRQAFHEYSASNCMLIALQCHQRGIVPEHVAGFHAWIKLGRSVRRGEKAIRILAPMTLKQREKSNSADAERRRVFFKTTSVFEVSQTDPIPGVEPAPLQPPCEPVSGDSHAGLLVPLQEFVESRGYSVSFEPIPGSTGGWCDIAAKRIVIDAVFSANAQLRTLVHETTHALGVDYVKYTRPQAEVIVDTTTLIVLGGVGLDTAGVTIPYVAAWGEAGALEAVTKFAHVIDVLARRIELVLDRRQLSAVAGIDTAA